MVRRARRPVSAGEIATWLGLRTGRDGNCGRIYASMRRLTELGILERHEDTSATRNLTRYTYTYKGNH